MELTGGGIKNDECILLVIVKKKIVVLVRQSTIVPVEGASSTSLVVVSRGFDITLILDQSTGWRWFHENEPI